MSLYSNIPGGLTKSERMLKLGCLADAVYRKAGQLANAYRRSKDEAYITQLEEELEKLQSTFLHHALKERIIQTTPKYSRGARVAGASS